MSLNPRKDRTRAKRVQKAAKRPDFGKPAAQRDASPYPSKWQPKLAYARDKYGISSAFIGHNRRESRAASAVARNCYRVPGTNTVKLGSRSKARRAEKRDFNYRWALARNGGTNAATK